MFFDPINDPDQLPINISIGDPDQLLIIRPIIKPIKVTVLDLQCKMEISVRVHFFCSSCLFSYSGT